MKIAYSLSFLLLVGGLGCHASGPGARQIVISANDNRLDLRNGTEKIFPDRKPDTLSVFDFATFPPSVTHIEDVANSVLGPPTNVAITPDQTLALVANAMVINPANPTEQIPDRVIHVIDLTSDPPTKIGECEAGLQPSGMSITPNGELALVANRADGTVSVLAIDGRDVRRIAQVTIGTVDSKVSHVAVTPDGKRALATRQSDNAVALLEIDGRNVTYTGRDMTVGLMPYSLDITADGRVAIVGNGGGGLTGDTTTAAVIDMTLSPPRVVNHVSTGYGPEQLVLSPDGRLVAVALMNGSNVRQDSPFRTEHGLVRLFRREGTHLELADEQPVGAIPEGLTFTNDGRYLLVQNYVDRTISVFRVCGAQLRKACDDIPVTGQPASIRAASRGRTLDRSR
jgi:DNA-binding beta-propeller fold protein YncE